MNGCPPDRARRGGQPMSGWKHRAPGVMRGHGVITSSPPLWLSHCRDSLSWLLGSPYLSSALGHSCWVASGSPRVLVPTSWGFVKRGLLVCRPRLKREKRMVGSPTVVGSWGDRHWKVAVEKGPASSSRLQLVVAFLTKRDFLERRQSQSPG